MGGTRPAVPPPPPPPPAVAPDPIAAAPIAAPPADPLLEQKKRIATGMAGRRSLFSTELGFGGRLGAG